MMMMMMRGRPLPPPLPQLPDPDILIDQKYINTKEWERKFNKWLMDGGEKPGPHPDPGHDWNQHPEKYIMKEEDCNNDENY